MSRQTPANRARQARQRAKRLGLRMVQCRDVFTLYDVDGQVSASGDLSEIGAYLAGRVVHRRPGPAQAPTPAAWAQPIADYCEHLAAAGQSAATIATRRKSLARIGRELGCAPEEVTAGQLVGWFGRQQWKPETRRHYRAAAREFFRWAYRTGRIPDHIADELPAVRIPPAVARPVPDDAWRQAITGADARTTLMLRLAGEAGLRRAEVAQVHVRDVVEGCGGPVLVVCGKGGRTRLVPIGRDLADMLRRGASGHTPELAAYGSGYLFPGGENGHLSAHHVGKIVAAALPPGWSMHKLRHRFATRAYRHGGRNLRAVQTLLGHTSIATTERYTAVDDDEVRAAALAATFEVVAPQYATMQPSAPNREDTP
ncbi:tyrosine-type recombinase/integrase [Mycobacterium intracellulare]|uniref:tyrosine-type recombinase/integrase n=1 Tax=Mycobacterium intracellulare TaxID=1767 RepID=UPI0035DB92B6|nr:tyrosine-type recombinase/integrase [Mycobacterium intracellulare]